MKTVNVISDLPVTTDRYKWFYIGDNVWRIIDTRSPSKDDQVCVTDSDSKANLIIAALNLHERQNS